MRSNKERGEQGERIAASFLATKKGFSIIARNWRNPADRREELDLVCKDGPLLVFVEVKTRKTGALVRGASAVDLRKQTVLRRAAFAYLRALPRQAQPHGIRFDIVEIALGPESSQPEICHFENAPLFEKRRR
jgi:putative endonuclease